VPDDRVDAAARELYAASPEDFTARRTEIAQRLRADGDAETARAVERLRKPTVAASIVNGLVLADPSVVDQLTDLGDRLRRAQHALDAEQLRTLSAERRRAVTELGRRAFERAGKRQPPAGLRDEVTGTFDAAIADPEIAQRLGRLQRSEQWSGFGFAAGGPELTLVRGGRDDAPRKTERTAEKKPPAPSAAERRQKQRALDAARTAFDAAEAELTEASAGERELAQQVKRLTSRLAKLQSELEDTRDALAAARKTVTAARGRRRDARNALDKAERAAE
jgi:hypothetical protein